MAIGTKAISVPISGVTPVTGSVSVGSGGESERPGLDGDPCVPALFDPEDAIERHLVEPMSGV